MVAQEMNVGLDSLRKELQRWQEAGRVCTFWWRDDDLIADTPQLRRMHEVSVRHSAPPLVAVIPQQADATLGSIAAKMPTMTFAQHGLSHVNHEPEGAPKSEFGAGRDALALQRDIRLGGQIMGELFGERFFPVFVPPWNTIGEAALAMLPAAGLLGVSQYGARKAGQNAGIDHVNTHVDIIDWTALPDPQVQPAAILADRFAEFLQLRREGRIDAVEPTGLLTHHRAMDDNAWQFVEQFFAVTREYSCVHWLDPRVVFSAPSTSRADPN